MSEVNGETAGSPRIATQAEEDRTDAEMVELALRDTAAFAALYRRHLTRVYRYVLAHVGDKQVAQEVTAQTFLAVLEGLAGYRGQGPFSAWLLRIARNKVADVHRTSHPTVPLDDALELPSTEASPERIAIGRLEVAEVARVLRVLAPDRAEAIVLRLFAGLSLAEVAEAMGRSEDAAKMLVHRGLRDLRARLVYRNEAQA
ncbi:MAG TPA: sigma-70 family RNA polymerase sigma factor [Ktedonobacterales bacterium]|jgi:RNA polymerase sigma-70 factor (ECF subfamily)|nr:sigma-70 family RNA polymerase sigma factor [Ktedonobacterales bacterium]